MSGDDDSVSIDSLPISNSVNWYFIPLLVLLFGMVGLFANPPMELIILWLVGTPLLFLVAYLLESISWLKESVFILSRNNRTLKRLIDEKDNEN